MKRLLAVMALCVWGVGVSAAYAAGHYTSGVEGINSSILPPKGFYYKMYNVFYNSTSQRDNNRDKVPGGADVSVFAQAHRPIYNTGFKFLGADYLVDAILTLQYTDLSVGNGAFSDHKFGLGDLYIEPMLLAWHGDRWHALAAAGFYAPTGNYDVDRPASPGMGFWTFMYSAGATVFLDEAKTWSASVLARYEMNTRQRNTDIRNGDLFHFEWGIGKEVLNCPERGSLFIGPAGYCHWQVTKGDNAGKEQVYSIGPEIQYTSKTGKFNVAVRSEWEFKAKNKTQGNVTTVSFVFSF